MIRKEKNTENAPRKEEGAPTGIPRTRSPYDWFGETDRWLDDLREGFFGRRGFSDLAPWTDAPLGVRAPPVEILDGGREFVVKAELPGVAKEDVDLNVTPDGIEVRARMDRQTEENRKDYYYTERAYSSLERVLPFPAEVLPEQAQANLKDGVLEVRVPKREPTAERKPVKVRVG